MGTVSPSGDGGDCPQQLPPLPLLPFVAHFISILCSRCHPLGLLAPSRPKGQGGATLTLWWWAKGGGRGKAFRGGSRRGDSLTQFTVREGRGIRCTLNPHFVHQRTSRSPPASHPKWSLPSFHWSFYPSGSITSHCGWKINYCAQKKIIFEANFQIFN
jgi:hypothetical protein